MMKTDSTRMERMARAYPITTEFLQRLPLLLTRGVVREITGLSDAELSAEVREGRIRSYCAPGATKLRYFRDDVVRIAGFAPA